MIRPRSKPKGDGPADDAQTGVPGFRTWPAVYGCVLVTFVLWVVLLAWLTRHYA
jgi:hypothetical protein